MAAAPNHNDNLAQEEILRAALSLYKRFGPNKVTMDDVAHALGRSRSSLYYYYKNRDEIFQAVLDTIASDAAQVMRRAVAEADGLYEKLYAFCLAKLTSSEDWKSVFNAMWASMNPDERSKHDVAMSHLHKKLVQQEGIIVNEILSDAMSREEIGEVSANERDMLAFIVSGSIRGIRTEVYYHHDPHDIKAAMQLLSGMIACWLKR